jgi:uncharacterized MAPEG superfamily protein
MPYIEIIAMLSLLQYLYFGYHAGMARRNSGLKAPAVTGDEAFERCYRVQMNTLEMLVIFIPSLLIAGRYWPPIVVGGLGCIYLIGRFIYRRAYISKPARRGIGFMLTLLPIVGLIALSVIGAILSLLSG